MAYMLHLHLHVLTHFCQSMSVCAVSLPTWYQLRLRHSFPEVRPAPHHTSHLWQSLSLPENALHLLLFHPPKPILLKLVIYTVQYTNVISILHTIPMHVNNVMILNVILHCVLYFTLYISIKENVDQ